MAIELYIGYSKYTNHNYFINPRGIRTINKHTDTFRDINSLLYHLSVVYKKRKAFLAEISNKISEDDKNKILDFIIRKELKIELNSDLAKKVS